MKSKQKNPIGRPSGYKPEMCAVVVEHMAEGASKTEVAAELGIHKDTFYEYAKKHQDFADAIKKGEQLSEAWWLKVGRKSLMNKEFNATLWYMNMKNRHGWRDKVENSGSMTIKHEDALKELE